MPGEMPVGSCSCGAVYACDETGHNLGSAMIEALIFSCNMDTDLAWGLLPEEDYIEKIVEKYDYKNHLIIPGGFYESRRISGALFFIKLHEDVQEVTSDGVQKRLDMAPSLSPKPSTVHAAINSLSKVEIENLVKEFRVSPILAAAGKDKRLTKNLQRLLYSGDVLFRRRAAEILGRVSAIISENNPTSISKLLQRLFTAIPDTAAFTWGAFEAIAEIISHKTELFGGYTPQLFQYLPDKTRRPQVLQAIEKISESRPELLRKYTFHFIPFLADPDPLARGYTTWLLGNLGANETREELETLQGDTNEIELYRDGNLTKMTVGQLASEALDKI